MTVFLRTFFIASRFFVLTGLLVSLWIAAYFVPVLVQFAQLGGALLFGAVLIDGWLLFRLKEGINAARTLPERFSNGDENTIGIRVQNRYVFTVWASIINEMPVQLQIREQAIQRKLTPGASSEISTVVRPVQRGQYRFGKLLVLVRSPLKLLAKRYSFGSDTMVPVYPSFLQMRGFELLAASNRLHEVGVKRIRKLGHTMEFERIREYVSGDDPRTVNWRATARRDQLMVNQYQDERAQPVYCLLDMGRVMRMPFNGLTLLDYSINASLVLANVALKKQDRVGLLTFSHEPGAFLPAEKRTRQLGMLLEQLYALRTDFKETDFERLYSTVRRQIKQRSLLLLFTNFESKAALVRQMPYLRALNRIHLLIVIFFENTELDALRALKPVDTESVYVRTIAEQFALEKQEVIIELQRHGIQTIYSRPENLSVDTLNKYLELKARSMI